MRKVVEVPLVTADQVVIIKVQINTKGRLRIKMSGWMKPTDITQVVTFLQSLSGDLNNYAYFRKTDGPARRRWGLF